MLAWCVLATPAFAQQQNAAQNLVTYFAEVQEQLAQGHMTTVLRIFPHWSTAIELGTAVSVEAR